MIIGTDPDSLADRLREQEEHLPICPACRIGTLCVVEERPDPLFGALGVVQRILKCDASDCGQLTVI
jgi:hypothetical protein